MVFSASLTCVSIPCVKGGELSANKGVKGGRGLEDGSFLRALTGHKYNFLMTGR